MPSFPGNQFVPVLVVPLGLAGLDQGTEGEVGSTRVWLYSSLYFYSQYFVHHGFILH